MQNIPMRTPFTAKAPPAKVRTAPFMISGYYLPASFLYLPSLALFSSSAFSKSFSASSG